MCPFYFTIPCIHFQKKLKMNRKPEKEKKTCIISFRVNQSDKEQIEYLVKLFGSDKSNWFRKHCKEIIHTLNKL